MLGTKDWGLHAVVMTDLDDHVREITGQPSAASLGEAPEGVVYSAAARSSAGSLILLCPTPPTNGTRG
jgi:hypothetical protein